LVFKLFKFKRAENKISWGNLVPKGLANLPNAKWHFKSHTSLDIQKVNILPLRRFGSQINRRTRILDNPTMRFKHKVKLAYRRPFTLTAPRAIYLFFLDISLHLDFCPSVTRDRALA